MPRSGRIATPTTAPMAGDGMSASSAVPNSSSSSVPDGEHERRQLGAGAGLVHRGGARGRGAHREAALRAGGDVAEAEGEQVAVRVERIAVLLGVRARDEEALGGGDQGERDRGRHEREPHASSRGPATSARAARPAPRRARRRPCRRDPPRRRRSSRRSAPPAPTGSAAGTVGRAAAPRPRRPRRRATTR